MTRRLVFTLLLCLPLLVAALPGVPLRAQDATPESTPDAAPDAAPSTAAEATATPLLPETFTTADGTFSFAYPAGWLPVESDGAVVLFNGTDVSLEQLMQPGQLFLLMDIIDKAEFEGLTLDPTPVGFLILLDEFSDVDIQNPTEIEINGLPAARAESQGISEEGLIIVMDGGPDALIYISAVSAEGEMAQFEPTILDIAASVVYTPPESTPVPRGTAELQPALPLTETFTSVDGTVTFNYPAGWLVNESGGVVALVDSDLTQLAIQRGEALQPGQLSVGIYLPALLRNLGVNTEADPALVLVQFFAATSGQEITESSITPFLVDDRRAARLNVAGQDTDGVFIALDLGNGTVAIMTLAAAPGEFARFELTALEIAGSLRAASAPPIGASTPIPNISAANLTERYPAGEALLSFNYPPGWAVRESSGTVILVNSPEFFTAPQVQWGSGQVGVIIYTPQFLREIGVSGEASLPEITQAFLIAANAQDSYSTPAEFTAGMLTIARTDATSITSGGAATQRSVWAVRLAGGTVLVVELVAGAGQLAQFEPTILAVLQSAQYTG